MIVLFFSIHLPLLNSSNILYNILQYNSKLCIIGISANFIFLFYYVKTASHSSPINNCKLPPSPNYHNCMEYTSYHCHIQRSSVLLCHGYVCWKYPCIQCEMWQTTTLYSDLFPHTAALENRDSSPPYFLMYNTSWKAMYKAEVLSLEQKLYIEDGCPPKIKKQSENKLPKQIIYINCRRHVRWWPQKLLPAMLVVTGKNFTFLLY